MSIERVDRAGGAVYRVRWCDEHNRNRSKVLGTKRDAEAFEAEVRRKKRTGDLAALDAGKQTLADFGQEWWRLYAEPNLAEATLLAYAGSWDRHILPFLGDRPIRDIDVLTVQRLRADLEAEGVGPGAVHKALVLLSGVLQRAVEWGHLPSNPVRSVRKPHQRRERSVRRSRPSRSKPSGRSSWRRDGFATRRSSPSSRTPASGPARRWA